ncbi:phage tail protein [Janthinobacterium sp. BJB301]|uniref:phage tail assembly protein n=1 Tax=Janthinobacterium TaxID=29580 RepID=UPI000C10B25D|nr:MULTISPECIES: phage tail assembly protein [Janthinobacterium]PHV51393.1 phage tail protein [Janthinobacterium sp. BJB301]STQ93496.1 Phage tail protein E [Janthinobacterium lividum]
MNNDNQNSAVIDLDEPIKRGDTLITSLTVRKPKAGALRGISLIELANLNVSALQIVLPRITEPTLTAHDIANMDPADLLAVGAEVAGFLASKADRLSVSPAK